jgi:zinc protease
LKRFQENVRDNGWWLQTLRLYEDEGINRFTNFQQLVLDISADDIQSLAQVFLTNANKAQIIMTPHQHDLNSR